MEKRKQKMKQNIETRQQARQQKQQHQRSHFDYEKYYNTPANYSYLKAHYYQIMKEISRGGFGVVYKAYGLDQNGIIDKEKKYAIKIIFSTINPEMIVGELAVLKLLQGQKNVIQLQDCFIENASFHLVFNYFKYDPFIFGLVHRDIKHQNFLYNREEQKGILIDFGAAELDYKIFEKMNNENKNLSDKINNLEFTTDKDLYQLIYQCNCKFRNKIGTEIYMPLESILRVQEQSTAVDIWGVGMILLQFIMQKMIIFYNAKLKTIKCRQKNYSQLKEIKKFDKIDYLGSFLLELGQIFGCENVQTIAKQFGYSIKMPNEIPQKEIDFKQLFAKSGCNEVVIKFLKKLIALDPKQRFTAEQALQDQFFDSLQEIDTIFNSQQQLQSKSKEEKENESEKSKIN